MENFRKPDWRPTPEQARLYPVCQWMPWDMAATALETIGRLANASGRELLRSKLTKQIMQTAKGPVTVLIMDQDAPIPEKITNDWGVVSRREVRFSALTRVHEYFESFTHK